jgi:hypothetical protein
MRILQGMETTTVQEGCVPSMISQNVCTIQIDVNFDFFTSHPLLPPEIEIHADADPEHDAPEAEVAVPPFKLGHVLEVHAVHAGKEGQGHEDRCNDGQHFHDLVQAVADRGEVGAQDFAQDVAGDLDCVDDLHKKGLSFNS